MLKFPCAICVVHLSEAINQNLEVVWVTLNTDPLNSPETKFILNITIITCKICSKDTTKILSWLVCLFICILCNLKYGRSEQLIHDMFYITATEMSHSC